MNTRTQAVPPVKPSARSNGAADAGTPPTTRTPSRDPQPLAPLVKPGASDVGVKHLHDGAYHKPTHQQIQQRAYEIWLRRGKLDGNAAVDWLQAERELITEINGKNAD